MELDRYFRLRGWTDLVCYEDWISGAKVSRPSLNRLMDGMRAGKIQCLVIYKLDRLGRSLTRLALILDELNRLRVVLIASSQGIDTSDDKPAGKLQLAVMTAVAELERGIIRERVTAGLAAARNRGTRLGRPKTLDRHASAILGPFRRGLGVRAIARELNLPASSVHSIVKGGSTSYAWRTPH